MIPNFLVIGAQKSGTAWMYQNFKTHPQIWVPPEKEIHFFDFPPLIPFYFLLFAPQRPIRHWAKNRMIRDYRKVRAGEQTASWNIRYYFFLRTRRWYKSLFTPGEMQIAGEITPRYSILSEKSIAKVHDLMPDIKIIYLLRNPIDRMWSDVAMYHSPRFGHQGLDTVSEQDVVKFLKDSRHLASSHYLQNLQRWKKFYPSSQIFVGFFDELSDKPKELLQSMYQFLEVDTSEHHISDMAYKKINDRDYPDMPDHIAKLLAPLLIDEVEKLHQLFNNAYTAEWLELTQKHLRATTEG
ncbi:MAG: sulfotransferase domain-containing protein [Methylococcaceae bacterium]